VFVFLVNVTMYFLVNFIFFSSSAPPTLQIIQVHLNRSIWSAPLIILIFLVTLLAKHRLLHRVDTSTSLVIYKVSTCKPKGQSCYWRLGVYACKPISCGHSVLVLLLDFSPILLSFSKTSLCTALNTNLFSAQLMYWWITAYNVTCQLNSNRR